MSKFVIDASVAAKWIIDERLTDEALEIFNTVNSFLAPDLFLMELDSIISKKVRIKELNQKEALHLRKEIRKWPYKLIDYSTTSKYAFELAITLPLTLYDATYLAVAIHHRRKLVTADRRLYNGLQTAPLSSYIKLLKAN